MYSIFFKNHSNNSLIINKVYIPDIVIDNKKYYLENWELYLNWEKIKNRKIINEAKSLGAFYFLSKLDPLFVSEIQFGVIDDLEKSVNIISRINDYYKKENFLVSDVYPISFLKQYINALRSQKSFYEEISRANALTLIDNFERLNGKYLSDALNIKKSIWDLSVWEEYKNQKISSLWNYTTFDIILKDFEIILKNSEELSREISLRKKCLDDYSFCKLNFNQKNDVSLNLDSGKPQNNLTQKQFNVKTECFWHKNEIFSIEKLCPERLNGLCYNHTDLVSEKFFIKNNNPFPFEKYLKEKGLDAIPKNITMPYNCMNYWYQTTLSNLNYYFKNYSDKIFFTNSNKSKLQNISNFDELGIYENQVFNDWTINEDSVRNLEKIFSNTLAWTISDWKSKQNHYLIDDLMKRSSIMKSNIMDLNFVLNHIISVNINYIISSRLKNKEFSVNKNSAIANTKFLIYSFRNDYSIFFLNFSPFVWKINEKPVYFKKFWNTQEYMKKQWLFNFNEAVKLYWESNVKKWEEIFSWINKWDFYYRYYDESNIGLLK